MIRLELGEAGSRDEDLAVVKGFEHTRGICLS